MKYAQPLKIWWLIILILCVSVLQGCAPKTPATTKQQGPQVVINKIEPRDIDGKAEITIEGTGPIQQYTSFQLTDPLRLVIDITDADLGTFKNKISVKSGVMNDITPSQTDNIARLEIGLTQAVDTKVYQSDGKLMVEIAKPGEAVKQTEVAKPSAEAAPAAETVAPAAPQEASKQETAEAAPTEKATATVISQVKATAGKGGIKVVIMADGTMNPHAFMVDKPTKKLVVDIPGVKSKVKQSVIPVRKGGLKTVRVGKHPDKVRVVLDLTKTLNYTVTPEGNSVIVAMGAAVTTKPGEKPAQERAASQDSEKAAPVEKETAAPQDATAVVPPVAKEQTPTAEKEAAQPKEAVAPVPMTANKERASAGKQTLGGAEAALLVGSSKYSGRRISLDLQDADLINVLRLFAEVANLNIVLAPDVKGKVTVRMVNIPWDQAMDTILRMNGLGYALEDNILRVASVGTLTKEAEDDLKSKEAKKKAEDLITRMIPINYATAAGVELTIKKSLSPRGETVVDARTNTLIIKDIARNVDEVVSLIKILDKPIAQIMIEAKIVEATLTFSRDIGIQWGGNFSADAAHGNPTGLSFPNSIGVTGGPGMGATASGNGNYLVNLPATVGSTSGGAAVGFQFGSLNKALNLDLVLSALESTGEGKIISQPKISALDNKEAKIEQGLSIPYATTSSSGTQIQFIDAKLSLIVTPHATPDNKIFLKISATKNQPDNTYIVQGSPAIRKNEATTEILLSDGETAVLGGIFTMDHETNEAKVPFFGDLPLIGWLFKHNKTTIDKRELLIFITPRVVKQEAI